MTWGPNILLQNKQMYRLEKNVWFALHVSDITFNNILVISWQSVLLVAEITVPSKKKHGPVASHWQSLSQKVVPVCQFLEVMGMDYIFNYYMIAAVTVSTRFGDVFFTKLVFGLSLPLVVCRMSYLCYLCLFVYNTYCVLFCFSLSCVPHVASFSGLSISVFYRVYEIAYGFGDSRGKNFSPQ